MSCHFPVTVRIVGTVTDDQLEHLAAQVEKAVTERIAVAERELGALLGDCGAVIAQVAGPAPAATADPALADPALADPALAAPADPALADPARASGMYHARRPPRHSRRRPKAGKRHKKPKPKPKPKPAHSATAPATAAKGPSGETIAAGARTLAVDALTWLLELRAKYGDRAVDIALKGPPLQPQPGPAADSIGVALGEVKLVSTKTTKVLSLRPWVIFETEPWNPGDGSKKRAFIMLKEAYAALKETQEALTSAQQREAAATSAPVQAAHRRKGKAAKKLPTVAQAQAAVISAESQVTDATQRLKQYVKSQLTSSHNPMSKAARAELSSAGDERQNIENQLKMAKHGKRRDQDEIDRLSALLAAAQDKESAAAATLADLLETLRTEIDQADWSQHEVDRTVTVYEVDGTRAKLTNRVEAYATVTPEGLEGKTEKTAAKGPTVPELLAKDTTLGESTKKILALISSWEGGFTTVNTWDIADVTFGMAQWTTGAGGKGDLTRALSIIKQAAPDAFAARLSRYGIDVDTKAGLVLTRPDGTVLEGVRAAKAIQADAKLTAVLSAAGTDLAIQAAELRAAYQIEVKGALNVSLHVKFPAAAPGAKATTVAIPVSALITSEYGVGVLANHTVHGGFPGKDLTNAINKYVASNRIEPTANPADWGPQAEDTLVAAISKGADAKRIDEMGKKLTRSTGSFR